MPTTASKNYIIATTKSWNIKNYYKLKKKNPNIHLITNKEDLNLENLKKVGPQFIFFPHWSWIIPDNIVNNYECIIFHMTDLPFGRGGSPLQNLIARGIYETKITALRASKEIDAGPIYCKENLTLVGSAQEIYMRASNIIFDKMIPYILEKQPTPVPQTGEPVIFRRRKPENGQLINCTSLTQIYDYIRMLDAEGYPRAFLKVGQWTVEFENAKIGDNQVEAKAIFKWNNNDVDQ